MWFNEEVRLKFEMKIAAVRMFSLMICVMSASGVSFADEYDGRKGVSGILSPVPQSIADIPDTPQYPHQDAAFEAANSSGVLLRGSLSKDSGTTLSELHGIQLKNATSVVREGGDNPYFAAGDGQIGPASATKLSSLAIGDGAQSTAEQAIAVGANALSTGIQGLALGVNAKALSNLSTALGAGSYVAEGGADAAVAIGYSAGVQAANGVSVGSRSSVTNPGGVALGSNANSTAYRAIALGADSEAHESDTLSIGASNLKRRIVNVAPGQNDTDAINVAQMERSGLIANGVSQAALVYDSLERASVTLNPKGAAIQIHNVSDATADTDVVNLRQLKEMTGGGSGPDDPLAVMYSDASFGSVVLRGPSGVGTVLTNVAAGRNPLDAVNFAQYSTLSQQVLGIDRRVADIEQGTSSGGVAPVPQAGSIAQRTDAAKPGARASGENSVAIGSGSLADRDDTVSIGAAGSERKLTNLSAGTEETDAVNVRQLNAAINSANAYTDQQVNMLSSRIGDVARKAYSGVAAATALTMIPDVDLDKTLAVGIGTGEFQGYAAWALGASARVGRSAKLKLGASVSNAASAIGAGASYQW